MACLTQRCSQGRLPCPTPLTCSGDVANVDAEIARFNAAVPPAADTPDPAREVADLTDQVLAMAARAVLLLAGIAGAVLIGLVARHWSIV